MKKYVTFNTFDLASIKKAEKQKTKLENDGWKLIHSSNNCLTYEKKN